MADMDIDIDMGFDEEDLLIPEVEGTNGAVQEPKPILSRPNDTSDSNATDPAPEKVHLRGLDNLTTKDIQAFTAEYYPLYTPKVEWIDDTSANIVYEAAEIARDALIAFSAVEILDVTHIPALQTIAAKKFPQHPETHLEVRLAVLGDRKQAGARDRSRFYLLNPEYDPAERRKREGYRGGHRGGDRYRDREDGGYRSQRYDDREQRKRERDTEFDASIYDDDEGARAKRAARVDRRPGSSGSDSRSRDGRRGRGFKGSRGKELFPDRAGNDGRLRNRSASPLRDNDRDRTMADIRADEQKRRQDVAVAANREKAQFMKARLREATAAKELFPTSSKRSGAFDAADETADLFANRMPVPFMDGEADRPTLASRITSRDLGSGNGGFNIRGVAAKTPGQQGFSIKGMALVKELFPSQFGDNAGKELFSGKLEARGGRRQKAEDLFS